MRKRARGWRASSRHGLDQPTGYVLRCSAGARRRSPGWRSEHWKIRRGKLFLIPGDSPVGFRLPLDSLPHVPAHDYPYIVPAESTARATICRGARNGRRRSPLPRPANPAPANARARQPVRTAITFEARAGKVVRVHAPVERLEDIWNCWRWWRRRSPRAASQSTSKDYEPPRDPASM